VDDRPPAGVPGYATTQRQPAAAAAPATEYAHHPEPPPERQRPERSDGQLLLLAGVLLVAAVLAFLLLRPGKPVEPPSTSKPPPTAVTQQEPRDLRDRRVFNGREWAIDQSGAVLTRDASVGGGWTSIPGPGTGWERFVVVDGTLFAEQDQGRFRVVLDHLPEASP
jgi:hypothetical protein